MIVMTPRAGSLDELLAEGIVVGAAHVADDACDVATHASLLGKRLA